MRMVVKSFIKIICFTILIVVVILVPPFFSLGDVIYDPPVETSSAKATTDNRTLPEIKRVFPDGKEVVVIGDSITEGSKPAIEEILPGVLVEAQKNKTVASNLEEGSGGSSGLSILKRLKSTGKLRDYVVFALGTNGGIKDEHIDKIEEIIGPDRQLIFVNLYLSEGKLEKVRLFRSYNRVLYLSTLKYDNITVADWETAAGESPETYISNDGMHVHPSYPEGTELFAETIYDTLREVLQDN